MKQLRYVWNDKQKKIINKKAKPKPYAYFEESRLKQIVRKLFSKEEIKDLKS